MPEPSGSPRPSPPPSADRGLMPSAAWYAGTGNTVLTPLPAAPAPRESSFQTVSVRPDPASCREQRRSSACPSVRTRCRELRVLISVDLIVGRPGVAGRGAEGHAMQRTGCERGVEPPHPLWRPAVFRRAPRDRHRRRVAHGVARGRRGRIDKAALVVGRVVADDGEMRLGSHRGNHCTDDLVVQCHLHVGAVRVWCRCGAVQPHVGDVRRGEAEARERCGQVEGMYHPAELDHRGHQLDALAAVGEPGEVVERGKLWWVIREHS